MKKSLTEILIDNLVGKKIKLFKVVDKQHTKEGNVYYLADKFNLPHYKNCEIVAETHGTIKSLDTEDCGYEGDGYYFTIVDDNNEPLNVHGLHTITATVEFLD